MKFFKRLGAVTGAVALLAGGLVGLAAPASADVELVANWPSGLKQCASGEVPRGWEPRKKSEELKQLGAEACPDGGVTVVRYTVYVDQFNGTEYYKNYWSYRPWTQEDCAPGEILSESGICEAPVKHEDRVCAYEVSKFVSSAGAATQNCKGLLSNPADVNNVTESQSDKAPNGKYLFTATVSTEYLNDGLDFVSPAEPSDWDECPEGLFPTGNGCEEEIVLGGPESRECDDGDVLDDGECREWEELVNIPGDSQGISLVDREDLVDRELDVNGDGESETVPLFDPNTPEEDTWVPGLRNDSPPSGYVPNYILVPDIDGKPTEKIVWVRDSSVVAEPVQKNPPPPPCWSGEAGNNCPVGGALRFVAPEYAMVGVPVTMYAYASWRPDANAPSQPTNGTAVIRVDGEDYSGVEFKDGIAEWRFIPETEGMKEFTASGVLFSGLSGANAYIDTVPARTYVLEYDPAAYATALKKKAVEVGDTYVITDPNQARSYLEDRYEWQVSEKSDDVCAVYETKKGAVKAKFNGEGKCTVIWMDKESEEEGKYTFIAKK
jgi:hypothetical protein